MSLVNVIIRHFYHLYVYMSHLTVSEGLFVIVLSICPMPLPQQDILSLSCLYVPLSLFTGIFFDLYPLYVPSGSFSRFLCRTEMFRKGKSVYLLVSITKSREIHNSMYYRLRRLLFFGIIRNLFSCCIHMKVFLHNQL